MKRRLSLRVKFVLALVFIISLLILSQQIFNLEAERLFIFLTLFIVILFVYIFIWRVLIPLERYRISIDRSLRGQYVDLKPLGTGEVAELGQKIIELIDKLKRKDFENFVISQIDNALLSNVRIDDSAEEILKILKDSLGYYRFSIYLVDKEEQKFRLLKSIGFEEKYLIPELNFGAKGLINYAYQFRTSVYSPDVLKDERYIQEHPSIRSEFDVPLKIGDEVIGILNVESDRVDGIKMEDREFLARISVQISSAFRNAELYNQAIRRLRQLNILNRVSRAIGFNLHIDEILSVVSNLIVENFRADKMAIFLINDDGSFRCVISRGLEERNIRFLMNYTPWYRFEKTFPIVVESAERNVSADIKEVLLSEGIKTFAIFPIVHREKFIGRVDVYFCRDVKIEKDEVELGVNICAEMASAIENARLFDLLKSSEKFIRTVLDNAPVGILHTDAEGKILYFNPEIKRILDIQDADLGLVGLNIFNFLSPEVIDKVKNLKFSGGRVREILPFKSFRGRELILAIDVEPVFSSDGRLNGYIAIAKDMTQEGQLQYERFKLSKVIENLTEAVMITDTQGRIEYVNPAFEKMTGYKVYEVLGQNPRILKSGKQDRSFYEKMWNTILSGGIWEGELINKRKNGDLYYEWMVIFPLFDSKGNITNFVAIKRDISEAKILEAQMLQFQKLESIGSIAGGIAHDFNNVIASIQTGLKILRRKIPTQEQEVLRVIEIIRKSAERGADITRRLLNFIRREGGKLTTVDVKDLIAEIKMLVTHSFPENIKVETYVDEAIKFINVDYGQMVQALMNLCINARDAMPEGGTLRIGARNVSHKEIKHKFPDAKIQDYVEISIADTGIGIPEEIRSKIFEPFFTTKPSDKGTGLGLSIVYKIVTSHGGYITFESKLGEGTCFYIFIPAVERKVEEKLEVEVEKLTHATLLIVEDEESLRYLLKEYLLSRGYTVIDTDDGYKAIELYKMNIDKIDLAIIDIGLPTIDGITTFRKIRQINPSACVVLTSGYYLTEPSPATLMAEEGLNGFIEKPYDFERIETIIERFVSR
ncbi:PAS domain S-box-containing protein [Candidatus Thermokryptus mobilis]|uniref:histidine kinase n=1 Tax=Candidatus Thermokryptus mobilis TaxID=1643428 RepID=A0A0S4NC70_9BACT|nr:PAS domain S-box protein [Candidatus Thermokryptus mobilis]CUU08501.1 PAS domain S-box-containing protein [Candidatus Thermokryptus mobilis]